MKIAEWDRWQSYRSDRGAPPWIKVHRNLMSNPEWAVLSDAEKGQLVSIWIVAADKSGQIPDEPRIIQKVCQLDKVPNISKLKDLGFIVNDAPQLDANLTPDGSQDGAPDKIRGETEESRVEESRGELMSGKPDDAANHILDFLNKKTGKWFKHVPSNISLITARLMEGHTEHEILSVIERKHEEWKDDQKMCGYLRPATLFNASKFNQYVGELGVESPDQRRQRELDDWANTIDGEVIHEQH